MKLFPFFGPMHIEMNILSCHGELIKGGGGGGHAFHFRKNDFELGVVGDGQDTSRHFEGRFRSIRAILPM